MKKKGMILAEVVFLCLIAVGGTKSFAAEASQISSCRMEEDGSGLVSVSGTLAEEYLQESREVFLFALKPYESELAGGQKPLASAEAAADGSFVLQTAVNAGKANSVLYSKFAAAVEEGGSYRLVTSWRYIENPEAVAAHQEAFPTAASKKGIQASDSESMDADLAALGVKQALINIVASQLFTTAGAEGAVPWDYNGTTYYFSGGLLEHYDALCKRLTDKGIVVTAVLLNRYYSGSQYANLYCAGETAGANYYEFNTQTAAGLNQCAALATFLADRYSGQIFNWIIGNEINNQQWNYYGNTNKETYAAAHARTLRVFYTAIRSVSKNARVYLSLDHEWSISGSATTNMAWYPGRDMIDLINADILAEGNIDWGVAYHPYPIPLSQTSFWDDNVSFDANAAEISFKNLNVLTDYLHREELLYEGTVRNVILSEQGFTSIEGFTNMTQRMQAAAYAYAYYIVEANPDIDSFLLSRHIDAPSETAAGLNFGLWTCKSGTTAEEANTKKYIWNVFRDIDTSRSASVSAFALEIIGVSDWETALKNCHASGTYSSVISRFSQAAAVDTSRQKPSVTYQGYVYKNGWNQAMQNQQTCGTAASGQKMEAVSVQLTDQPYDGGVQYRSYIRGVGWQGTAKDSDSTGRQNTNSNMTALQINLTGTMGTYYDIVYRVHLHDGGWSAWMMDGQTAGNTASSSYIEAVQIGLKEKGSLASVNTACSLNAGSKFIVLEGQKGGISVSTLSGWLVPSTGLVFQTSSGQAIAGGTKIGTGSRLVYRYQNTSGNHTDTWQIAVRGDGNGDGLINIADITRQVGVAVGRTSVSGIMKEGCDANGDGTVNIADITKTVGIIR